MKTKGFTLIELLAVIVILAIIALIATPIVISIISNSREQTELRNAEMYISAAKQGLVRKNLFEEMENPTCEVQENGNLSCDGEEVLVDTNGEKATLGTLVFEDEKVVGVKNLHIGNKYYNMDLNGNIISRDKALYTLTKNLTNLTATEVSEIESDSSVIVTLTATTGYVLPATVTVTGASSTYDNESGIITLTNATGNVTITAVGIEPPPYTVVEVSGICRGEKSVTIGSQNFCVVKEESNGIVLLTEKFISLSTTAPRQTDNYTNNKFVFSNSRYWKNSTYEPFGDSSYPYVYDDDNSNSYNYVEKYREYIEGLIDNENVTVEGRLLSYEEAKGLSSSNPLWLRAPASSSSYWLGTAYDASSNKVWSVDSTGHLNYALDHYSSAGLRPVIVISQS